MEYRIQDKNAKDLQKQGIIPMGAHVDCHDIDVNPNSDATPTLRISIPGKK